MTDTTTLINSDTTDLLTQLSGLKEKQIELRMQHNAGQLKSTHLLSQNRKSIANLTRLLHKKNK